MVKTKNIEDLLAEQAVRKAATCYSRGVDRSDLDLLKSAFHDDAEVKYGSYDGHHAEFCKIVVDGQADMDYTTHTVVNEYYDNLFHQMLVFILKNITIIFTFFLFANGIII